MKKTNLVIIPASEPVIEPIKINKSQRALTVVHLSQAFNNYIKGKEITDKKILIQYLQQEFSKNQQLSLEAFFAKKSPWVNGYFGNYLYLIMQAVGLAFFIKTLNYESYITSQVFHEICHEKQAEIIFNDSPLITVLRDPYCSIFFAHYPQLLSSMDCAYLDQVGNVKSLREYTTVVYLGKKTSYIPRPSLLMNYLNTNHLAYQAFAKHLLSQPSGIALFKKYPNLLVFLLLEHRSNLSSLNLDELLLFIRDSDQVLVCLPINVINYVSDRLVQKGYTSMVIEENAANPPIALEEEPSVLTVRDLNHAIKKYAESHPDKLTSRKNSLSRDLRNNFLYYIVTLNVTSANDIQSMSLKAFYQAQVVWQTWESDALQLFCCDFGLEFLLENPQFCPDLTARNLHNPLILKVDEKLLYNRPARAILDCKKWQEFIEKFPDFLKNIDFSRLKLIDLINEQENLIIEEELCFNEAHMQHVDLVTAILSDLSGQELLKSEEQFIKWIVSGGVLKKLDANLVSTFFTICPDNLKPLLKKDFPYLFTATNQERTKYVEVKINQQAWHKSLLALFNGFEHLQLNWDDNKFVIQFPPLNTEWCFKKSNNASVKMVISAAFFKAVILSELKKIVSPQKNQPAAIINQVGEEDCQVNLIPKTSSIKISSRTRKDFLSRIYEAYQQVFKNKEKVLMEAVIPGYAPIIQEWLSPFKSTAEHHYVIRGTTAMKLVLDYLALPTIIPLDINITVFTNDYSIADIKALFALKHCQINNKDNNPLPELIRQSVENCLAEYAFTIDTACWDSQAQFHDLSGYALNDLKARRLRMFGNPTQQLAQHPLLILRAFRLMVEGFKPDDHLQQALKNWQPESEHFDSKNFFERLDEHIKNYGEIYQNYLDDYQIMAKLNAFSHLWQQSEPLSDGGFIEYANCMTYHSAQRVSAYGFFNQKVNQIEQSKIIDHENTMKVAANLGMSHE